VTFAISSSIQTIRGGRANLLDSRGREECAEASRRKSHAYYNRNFNGPKSVYRAYFHDDESPRVFRRDCESISCRNNAAESPVSKFSGSRSKSLTLISYTRAIRYVFLSHDMCMEVRMKKESSRFDTQHSAVDFVMTLLYTSTIFLPVRDTIFEICLSKNLPLIAKRNRILTAAIFQCFGNEKSILNGSKSYANRYLRADMSKT